MADGDGNTGIDLAIIHSKRNLDLLSRLLQELVDYADREDKDIPSWWVAKFAAHTAVKVGRMDVITVIEDTIMPREYMKDCLIQGRTIAHTAAQYGHVNMIEYAVSAGVGLDEKSQDGHTAFDIANKEGHLECTSMLLESGSCIHF